MITELLSMAIKKHGELVISIDDPMVMIFTKNGKTCVRSFTLSKALMSLLAQEVNQ